MPINIDGSKGIRQNTTEVTKIPVGTTAQRPANPEAGMIRFNTDERQVETYNPIKEEWQSISESFSVQATGGTVTDIEQDGQLFRVHTFTSDGTFEVTAGGDEVEYLVVAGGGGAGGNTSFGSYGHGGAGAGGLVQGVTNLSTGSLDVIVGAGGSGINDGELADRGENSEFASITALGGGPSNGDARNTNVSQLSGGSGAGQGNRGGTGGNATQPGSASGGFGNKGGDGADTGSGNDEVTVGAGGGGAGAPGNNAGENPTGDQGNGGAGISSLISGTETFYAGGGGGGGQSVRGGAGGIGGGGNGASNGEPPSNADPNTGGGGGAGSADFGGGNGGSGIVIVRYRIG